MAAVMKRDTIKPTSMRDAVAAAVEAHPYAEALKHVGKGTAQRVLADDPLLTPQNDPFARAIKRIGGIKAATERARIGESYLLEVIFGGEAPDPVVCWE